jgi:putative transposase
MEYSTDLTDKQWKLIESFSIGENRGKHFQTHSKRDLVNAVLHLNKTGCQWRLLPYDFPPYAAVWSFYRRTVKSGLWEKITACLARRSRTSVGRPAAPSYSLIDSQSTKAASASEGRGIDGGKKRRGESVI